MCNLILGDNQMLTVVIDPGHGGRDPGAVGHGLLEKDLALDIALNAADILGDRTDILSLVTHEGEIHRHQELGLRQRCDFANRHNADVFVSVHCNAFSGSQAHGYEVFSHPTSGRGATLSADIFNAIGGSQRNILPRSPKTANFMVLRDTHMPAALVECGFITNPSDSSFLGDSRFRLLYGRAIANGILKYLGLS